MELKPLAGKQGSYRRAIFPLVLVFGAFSFPGFSQESPRKKATGGGEDKKPPAAQADTGPPAPDAKKTISKGSRLQALLKLDKVHLTDGSVQHGSVVELGGNAISLEYRGAAKRILKADVEKIDFFKGRHSQERLDTDLVVLKVNQHRVPCTVIKETGAEIRIELANGAKVTYRRDTVLRVHYRNQILNSSSDYYTAELVTEMDKAIDILFKGEPAVAEQAEKFLVRCGTFALEKVQKARGGLAGVDGAARAKVMESLDRILQVHDLKKVVTFEMETAEPKIYQELVYGSLAVKDSLLKVLYPKFVEESVPLAKYLISRPGEDVRLRSLSVEILRRLNQNKALLDLYNESKGELKMVAAVALVRNRIFFPAPTLIEALELGGEKETGIRALAARLLRDSTRNNFGFRADGTPAARAEAVEKWKQWWKENSEQMRAKSLLVLNNQKVETDARKESRVFWVKAHQFWVEKRYDRAASYLREARRKDPSFLKAHVSYATLLYSELARVEKEQQKKDSLYLQAAEILKGFIESSLPEATEQDLHWIHFEFGNVLRLQGNFKEALDQYETSRVLDSSNLPALLGVADCHWGIATGRNELTKAERKLEVQSALEHYRLAEKEIRETLGDIQVLGAADIPQLDSLPFQRRAHNRTALALREELEKESIRLYLKYARVYRMQENSEKAVVSLRQGLQALGASTELEDTKLLEADLRAMMGVIYESMGEDILAVREYLKVVKELDRTNQVCRRGYERLRKRLGKKKSASSSRG